MAQLCAHKLEITRFEITALEVEGQKKDHSLSSFQVGNFDAEPTDSALRIHQHHRSSLPPQYVPLLHAYRALASISYAFWPELSHKTVPSWSYADPFWPDIQCK